MEEIAKLMYTNLHTTGKREKKIDRRAEGGRRVREKKKLTGELRDDRDKRPVS